MTAYTWRSCTECGQAMLLNRTRPCALTPGCRGSHRDSASPQPPTSTPAHPAQFTPAILDTIEPTITRLRLPVHDPFAGTGARLGQLCDRRGLEFTGTEIEPEFIGDPRVRPGDSTEPDTYPAEPYVVVTSPAYPNGMADHFYARDSSRRHTYRQALAENLGYDRELHKNNMGRYGNRYRRSPAIEDQHFAIADACIRHWPEHVLVNVKDVVATRYTVPVVERWRDMLQHHGYTVTDTVEVATPGQRHGANAGLRADHEAVLIAHRPPRSTPRDTVDLPPGGTAEHDPLDSAPCPRRAPPPWGCSPWALTPSTSPVRGGLSDVNG